MSLRSFTFPVTVCLTWVLIALEGTQGENTWLNIQLPRMSAEVLLNGVRDVQDKVPAEDAHKADIHGGAVHLKVLERGLSFQQASAKNLSDIQRTKVTFADATGILNMKVLPTEEEARPIKMGSRKRRHIYGSDTRSRITDSFRKTFPFSAVARLSTGCSGILIGPKHVLTAAECIHNGRRYRSSAKNLEVGLIITGNHTGDGTVSPTNILGVEERDGLEWYDVEHFYIPDGWLAPSYGQEKESFNYAVLELSRTHGHNCMEVGVSSLLDTANRRRIHFSSFDDYTHHQDPVLTYRHCYTISGPKNYLYEQCDSTRSSIGAGIYLRLWDSEDLQWSRRVMAVKTANTERMKVGGKRIKVNRDVRITLLNFGQICYWVMRDFEACSRGRIEDACLIA